MSNDVFEPFNDDVQQRGGYIYSTTDKLSAVYSAGKNTKIILQHADLSGKDVLDVGCGDGTYTNELWKHAKAKSILGIDPAANSIEVAQKKYGANTNGLSFKNCFAKDVYQQGLRFDAAVCRGVLHHVGDPKAEIECLFKLADTLYIVEPNGLNIILKLLERFSKYHREHKEQSYKMSTFKKWISEGGGKVSKAFYHGLVPYFCPDILVHIGRRLEPVIEPIPGVNALACGRMFLVAQRK